MDSAPLRLHRRRRHSSHLVCVSTLYKSLPYTHTHYSLLITHTSSHTDACHLSFSQPEHHRINPGKQALRSRKQVLFERHNISVQRTDIALDSSHSDHVMFEQIIRLGLERECYTPYPRPFRRRVRGLF